MWKVLPKFALFKTIFLLYFLLIIGVIAINDSNFEETLKLSSVCTLSFLLLVFILAKWVWKPIWKIPFLGNLLNRYVCPDLNGSWIGNIQSNFKQDGSNISKEVKMDIKADFLGFDILLISEDQYSNSKVIQCDIYKDALTGTLYLSYIFRADVPLPQVDDDKSYEGAAILAIEYSANNELLLSGTYWTNRAWHKDLNTAGRLSLRRDNR